MREKIRSLLTFRNLALAFFLLTITTSIQKFFLHNINNYLIFSRSFGVLLTHQNLYAEYPALYNDRFLYSPTFALIMCAFYYLPDLIGVILWNLINAALFFYALKKFAENEKKFLLIFLLVAVELFNAVQNNQSNPLVTALILLAFTSFEKRRAKNAALFIAALFFIKIYGFSAAVFAAFHAEKLKFAKWLVFSCFALLILPLVVISWQELFWQYKNWFDLITHFKTGAQLSVMGLVERLSGQTVSYFPIQIAGLIIFLAPLIYFGRFSDSLFRRKFLCSLLIFLVIFNQSAESPTYVTAVTGAAIWFAESRKSLFDYILIFLVLIFTSLASTSIFPAFLRHDFFEIYGIKVIPCLLVWLKIQFELHAFSRKNLHEKEAG